LLSLCARPPIHSLAPLLSRLPSDFHLLSFRVPGLFDSPFTPSCQSWQAINQRLPPRLMFHHLFRLSTKCVLQPPDVKVTLTTDFPALQLPVLYVVRSSISSPSSPPPLIPLFSQQIVVYTVVIFAVWNIPAVRNVINPLKLFTIGWHELCHIIVVSDFHPGVYCQNPQRIVAYPGGSNWRNDSASIYRSERWWMHQGRRRLSTSHSRCGLYRVNVPWCGLRLGGLRHACIENNELGHRFWHDRPLDSGQGQAVRH
jgi:hypothetical protein